MDDKTKEVPLHVLNEEQRRYDREMRDQERELSEAAAQAVSAALKGRRDGKRTQKPVRPVAE